MNGMAGWFRIGLLAAFAVLFLFPVYWLAVTAVKIPNDQFAMPPVWFPTQFTGEHFRSIFDEAGLGRQVLNSGIAALASTALALLFGTTAAYSLSRFRLRGRLNAKILFWVLSTRMFPPIVSLVPLFLIMRTLGLVDTRMALVLTYAAFNLPFVVWMMKGFFDELPRELEESAQLDGVSPLGAFLRVALPLVRPGLAATAIFCLIVAWNEFLFALVLTQTEASQTLPVGISSQVTQYEIRWGAMSAAGLAAAVPIFAFALMVQKQLIRGLSLGAVKG